jgi:hypothetical protein
MDIARFVQVAWRFRLLLAAGLALASLTAVYSAFSISLSGGPKLSYKSQETWLSASSLLVTQAGFPWGRATLDETIVLPPAAEGEKSQVVPRFSDPGRFSGLAALYSQLAKADAVVSRVRKKSGPFEYYDADVVKATDGSTALPMIYIKGYGPSKAASEKVANVATEEFRKYLEEHQDENRIADDKRVEVVVTQRATDAVIFEKRSLVRPIMMFLLISMGFLALAFALENMRPRTPRASEAPGEWKPQAVPDAPRAVPEPPVKREREPGSASVWSR